MPNVDIRMKTISSSREELDKMKDKLMIGKMQEQLQHGKVKNQ